MEREYDLEFKAKVGAWAVSEGYGIAAVAEKFDVPNDLVYEWAQWVLDSMSDAIADEDTFDDEQEDLDDSNRATLVRLSAEYGRITKSAP